MRHFASNFALVNAPERMNFFIAMRDVTRASRASLDLSRRGLVISFARLSAHSELVKFAFNSPSSQNIVDGVRSVPNAIGEFLRYE